MIHKNSAMKNEEVMKNFLKGSDAFFKARTPLRVKNTKNTIHNIAPTNPNVIKKVGRVPKPLENSEFQKTVGFISNGL